MAEIPSFLQGVEIINHRAHQTYGRQALDLHTNRDVMMEGSPAVENLRFPAAHTCHGQDPIANRVFRPHRDLVDQCTATSCLTRKIFLDSCLLRVAAGLRKLDRSEVIVTWDVLLVLLVRSLVVKLPGMIVLAVAVVEVVWWVYSDLIVSHTQDHQDESLISTF
jgi:hypothetical protein